MQIISESLPQINHVWSTLFSGTLSIIMTHFIWKKWILNHMKEEKKAFLPYIKPLISYALFILILSGLSVTFDPQTTPFFTLTILSQIALFFVAAYYIYLLTKSWPLFFLSLLGLITTWFINKTPLLKPSLNYLNKFSIKLGAFQLTPFHFLKSIFTILIFLWVTSSLSQQIKNRIKKIKTIKANTKEILFKTCDVFIYFIASILVLNILGINLSTLTVIGGALGVGIGFGLQKITSNFISGLILLFEKSIQMDDLVEMDDGTYGFVRRLGSRYTLIETFDGKEIFIPNEDFITNRVTNWTFSNKNGRIDIEIGISYASDIEKAQSLILEAATEHPRCLKDPPPKCFLREFGDSAVKFKLLFFIPDVEEGRWEPQSEVMISIWKKLKANNIQIPFPQRDIHITTEHKI